MKTSNAVVTVIVIAAVLVFAYGLGLLIRQARTGNSEGQKHAEVDKAAAAQHAAPRVARTADTVEQRMRIKELRTQAREDMNNPTPEKVKDFQERVVAGMKHRRGRGARAMPAPASQAQTTPAPSPAPAGATKTDANAPAAGSGSTTNKPSPEQKDKTGTEPGKAGPG